MIGKFVAGVAIGTCVAMMPLATASAAGKALKVTVGSVKNGKAIPDKFTFCVATPQGHAGPSADVNPSMKWSKGPRGTKSYAIIVFDPDVPINRATMNKENAPIPAAEPRRVFYHFLVADISTTVTSLAEGAASNARVVRGKPAAQVKIGVAGLNDFDPIFASNDAMKGKYYGYDGMCPPWNDSVPHHYHFTVYALSVPKLELKEGFNGTDMMAAIKDKVLAQGEAVGVYSTNPDVIAKLPK